LRFPRVLKAGDPSASSGQAFGMEAFCPIL
jgi:hypothetical protein